MADARRLIELGMVPELAAEVAAQIAAAAGAAVAWGNVTGTQDGVESAVATKTEIAALTSDSDAADIVAALQA